MRIIIETNEKIDVFFIEPHYYDEIKKYIFELQEQSFEAQANYQKLLEKKDKYSRKTKLDNK